MPQRIANVAVTLHRDGKRIEVMPGKPFNFTKTEINDLNGLNPNALRLPVDESDPNLEGEDGEVNQSVDEGSIQTENRVQKQTVKAAKQAGAESGSSKKDEKKAADAGLKEEGSNSDDGEL